MTKSKYWVFIIIGSTIGSYLPVLWGGSMFSFSSIILTAVGGISGLYLGYKLDQMF